MTVYGKFYQLLTQSPSLPTLLQTELLFREARYLVSNYGLWLALAIYGNPGP